MAAAVKKVLEFMRAPASGFAYVATEPEFVGRFPVRPELFEIEPLCQACGLTVDDGVASGCRECVIRSVMDS